VLNSSKEEIHWLTSIVPGLLETRGLVLLGWANGDEEILLLIWFVHNLGWLGIKVLGG
jgi:hypothetical protein